MTTMNPCELLANMFTAAVDAAQPELCIPRNLPAPPKGRTVAIGAGKASAAMAQALERSWPGPLSGLVVTRYGYAVPCERIEIVEAAHPVPDATGREAAQRMLRTVRGLSADDLVICLVSGGGSALLPLPGEGVTLEDKQAINRALLASGASITEMNCVRRHLSAIKGGRLAAACHPARVVNLLISDVPGDNPMDIASGPTVADPTTCADALEVVRRYGIELPVGARRLLESGAGAPGIHALAGDTDGVDGAEEIAGAFVAPDTLARGWAHGMPPRASLDNNDAHTFFRALGNSLITGPTLTNVNDFRAIYVA
jgi:glycerate 2-kinase